MKVIFVIIVVCFTYAASANNYYFSSVSGNDSRTSSEAQDPATPWKTLDKLNSLFISLKPGDSIFLKRDEIFYGALNVKKSGSLTAPIFIGTYGSGNKPVITSLVTLTNWISKGKGIWETVDSTLGSTINMVLFNGVEQEMGRYPNSDAPNNGYLNFESHAGKTSITDNELNTATNWSGAELVTRPRHWILERSLITSQAGHTISYSTSSPYEPYENYGYFIQNSIKTLDKIGEWYYNPFTKKFSAYFGSKGPSAYVMQAATATGDLVSSVSASNIIFDNLSVKGSNSSGFFINNGSNIHIQNCDILFSGVTGVLVHNHRNLHIENCTIATSNNNGINMEYGVSGAVIRNNKILNTAVLPGMLENGEGNGLGIYANGDGNTIDSNIIRKTGFIGITFYGNNIIIRNNVIDTFCFVKDDGGGIYSHGGITVYTNRLIEGNIVMNGIGAGKGTDIADKRSVTGIYMDADITNVEIRKNTVTTCYQGIFIQSSAGMVIKNNTVFDNIRQMTIIQRAGDNPVRNSTITQNIFFSKNQDEWASYIMSSADDISLFGRFDSNYYARPLDDRLTIFNSYIGAKGTVTRSLDLNGWQQIYGQDKHSKKSAKQIEPYKIIKLIDPNKFDGGDFTNDINGIAGNSCVVSSSHGGMLDGGYLTVTPSSRSASVYIKVGAVTAGKNYILSYSLRGSVDDDMSIGASLKQTGAPFTALTTVQSRRVNITRTENQLIFTPSSSQASTYLIFKTDGQSEYYLDNIKFHEAKAQVTNPDDSIRFEYNANNINKFVSLNGNYIDATGKLYLKSIKLRPYTSAVLIKTGDNVKNSAPTVKINTPRTNTVFDAYSNVPVGVTAADADGSIDRVEFYNNSTLLKSVDTANFSCTLDSLAPGKYVITAKAFDNNGVATTSAPVTFTVSKANIPPTVSITAPANNVSFMQFSKVVITATAADANGSVVKVDFYNDSTLLKTADRAPYSCTLDSIAAGHYTITARATDDKGAVTVSAPVLFIVTKPNVPPTISITSPANNAMFSPRSTVAVNAAAADSDGSVSQVDFYSGTTLVKTVYQSPYKCDLDSLKPGNYTITARATDDKGSVTLSSPVLITVDSVNVPPVVNIVTPANNAVFKPFSSITINADASDIDGTISKVQFYNGSTLIKTELKAPYDCTLDSLPVGNYAITVRATDNNGAAVKSTPVLFSVKPLNIAPTVSITTDNATYLSGANVYLTAVAADDDGTISKVEFYNGATLLFTAADTPYTFKWDHVYLGNYALTARATDNTGLVTTSAPVNIAVVPNKRPTINITSPANDQTFSEGATIHLEAAAADSDGRVTRVDFYAGTALVSTKYKEPYSFSLKNQPPGNYIITAKATDNWGGVSASSPVNISVIANKAPVVSITSPAKGQTFKAPAIIEITAVAGDTDGVVSKVEFFNGSTLLTTEYAPPYSYTLANVPAGSYTISAKATDNNGLSAASTSVLVSVAAPLAARSSSHASAAPASKAVETVPAGNSDISGTVGIPLTDGVKLSGFRLLPNPAINMIQLYFNENQIYRKADLTIQTAAGAIIKKYPTTISGKKIEVDISSLRPGIYIIRLSGDNFAINKKFLKVNR